VDLPTVAYRLAADPLLPTPQSADGGSMETHRGEGTRLKLAGAVSGLLPTPQAGDGTGGQTSTPDQRRAKGHQLNLPQVAVHDLLPTPVAKEVGTNPARYDEWCAELKEKHGNGNGHGRSLSVEAQRIGLAQSLLPTPTTSDGRGASTGGAHDPSVRVPRLAAAVEVDMPRDAALLPTPCVVDRLSSGGMTLAEWDESRRSQKERGVGSYGPRGDSLGAAVLRAHEGTVDERPDFSSAGARDDG